MRLRAEDVVGRLLLVFGGLDAFEGVQVVRWAFHAFV